MIAMGGWVHVFFLGFFWSQLGIPQPHAITLIRVASESEQLKEICILNFNL